MRRTRNNARASILRVFAGLVAERGYSDASIADVADELGLSKGTVAFHFPAKTDLLDQVTEAYMRRRLDEAHHILANLASPAEQLSAMIYALVASHRDDRDATRAFLREFVRFADSADHSAVRSLRQTYTELVHGIVRRGMEKGDFRNDDSRLVTLQIFGMCNYIWTWYSPQGRNSVEEIAASFTRTVLAGLRPGASSSLTDSDIDRLAPLVKKTVESAPGRLPG